MIVIYIYKEAYVTRNETSHFVPFQKSSALVSPSSVVPVLLQCCDKGRPSLPFCVCLCAACAGEHL